MWTRRQFLNLSLSAVGFSSLRAADKSNRAFKFGVIADPQYADATERMGRFYRQSLAKLDACIDELNKHDLEFTVTVGDLIDRDFSSFDPVLERYKRLRSEHRVVLGNHDFDVADEDKGKVLDRLGLERGYYSHRRPGWKMIVLDGTETPMYRYAEGTEGNYAQDKHCHYVNLKGMVETETTSAFAVVTCYPDHITVDGFGTEPDRLDLR